jgi:homoserine dehydrogenase
MMKTISLVMVGFGNVGKAFAQLILDKADLIQKEYQVEFRVTGIATTRHGIAVDPRGIDLQQALQCMQQKVSLDTLCREGVPTSMEEFVQTCPGDALLENSPVNHHTGQPAVGYIRSALMRKMHVVSANKGPVVHAYRELTDLAARQGVKYYFESAVMDGMPIFSLFRSSLPAVELRGFLGILNSTTNLILEFMEKGKSFEEAVQYAQVLGIAEADPAEDVDGWDAAIKVSALATVLMGLDFKPQQVQRQGIAHLTPRMVEEARQAGERWKLVCRARRTPQGLEASVMPQRVSSDSPLYHISGTSSYVQFETDVLAELGMMEGKPGTYTTAYGLLADLLNILQNR